MSYRSMNKTLRIRKPKSVIEADDKIITAKMKILDRRGYNL